MRDIKGLDSRQIPKTIEICSNKKYHDVLYSYLQENSEWDGVQNHPRFVEKSFINFSQLAKTLGISRQTCSNKFKNLIELGLIYEEEGRYYLQILPADIAALIPQTTLKLLVDVFNEHAISVYIYLLLKYIKNDQKSFTFTLKEVKNYIGICSSTRSNDEKITNILFVLQKIGLIKYGLTTVQQDNVDFVDIKTIYEITFLTNFLQGC